MFENIRLTPEERKRFAAAGIKNPYGSFDNAINGINPIYLTIDKERDMWLTWCYNSHEPPFYEEFMFRYKDRSIFIRAERCSDGVKVRRIELPEELRNEESVISEYINAALAVYSSGQ